jgi:hypothetical protein
MTQHSKTRPCPDCSTPISTEPISFRFRDDGPSLNYPPPKKCDDCIRRDEAAAMERERLQALENDWAMIAPPIYHTSDTARFPQQLQDALDAFDPASTIGIGIRGASGLCKTRAAYQLLKKAHFSGYRVAATRATTLANIAANQWDNRPHIGGSVLSDSITIGQNNQKTLQNFSRCEWLFIDDIGKEVSTARNESTLWDILEERTSNHRPTIWTLNMSASDLNKKGSKDRMTPILRRLTEFSELIILD